MGPLSQTYGAVSQMLRTVADDELARPSRCAGWSVADVVVHLLGDAQRTLVACATPTEALATTDSVGYWRDWAVERDPDQQAREAAFTRTWASAYRPDGLRRHWRDTAEAAVRALAARRADERVRTQGYAIAVGALERTLVVETVVHHLDCLRELPGQPAPPAAALALVLEDFSALAGVRLPAGDDVGWVLRGAGRLPLQAGDRAALGAAADRFPLLT